MEPLGFMAVMIICLTLLMIGLANRQHNHSIDFTREQCDHERTKEWLTIMARRVTELDVKEVNLESDLTTLTERFQALTCQLEHDRQISLKARHSVNDLTDMLAAVEETGKKATAEVEQHVRALAARLDGVEHGGDGKKVVDHIKDKHNA